MDSIGRSSGVSQTQRRRTASATRTRTKKKRPQPNSLDAAMARAGDLLAEREQQQDGFVPYQFGADGQEWLAVSFTGDETAAEVQRWPEETPAVEEAEDEEDTDFLLPDTELISAGRPVPEELLTIRPEYSDDLSKITNKKLYEEYIHFLSGSWPGWTAPRNRPTQNAATTSAAVGDLARDLPDPRRDPGAGNAEWQRLEETSSWLVRLATCCLLLSNKSTCAN